MRRRFLCVLILAIVIDAVRADELPGDTNSIQTLTVEQAQQLVRRTSDGHVLPLDGLIAISPEVAEALAAHPGPLALNGLTELSDEAAGALAKHEARLELSGLTTLSDTQATILAKHKHSLGLDGLTTLSPREAEALATHKGPLSLNGLAAVSDGTAGGLAKHGGGLSLDGLATLSDAAIALLATHDGDLSLSGLTTLSGHQAEAFAKHKGYLQLGGLTEITPECAEALSRHQGLLGLGALTSLTSVPLTEKLVRDKSLGPGWSGGFPNLTPETAAVLAKQPGSLSLNGLTALTPGVAKALAQHTGPLSLDSVTTLTPEAAKALARHEGGLSLYGLTSVTPDVAEALAGHRSAFSSTLLENMKKGSLESAAIAASILGDAQFFGQTRKWTDIPPELARAVAMTKSGLNLSGLTALTPEVARALSHYKGYELDLSGLRALSVEAARALSQGGDPGPDSFWQAFNLRGLTTITPEQAAALANCKSHLLLDGLTHLSDEAAEALARHEGGMTLGITALSDTAARALAQSPGRLRLLRLADASPKALALLKARGQWLSIPLQMYSPLERFTWGLTGWLQLALLGSLAVMIGCIAGSFYLARRLSKATAWTLAIGRQAKQAAVPLLVASGLFSGWCFFLSMKLLPQLKKLYDDLGTGWPPEGFASLDRIFGFMLLTLLAAGAYWVHVCRRCGKLTPPLWGMTTFLPPLAGVPKPQVAMLVVSMMAIPFLLLLLAGVAFLVQAWKWAQWGWHLQCLRDLLVSLFWFAGGALLLFIGWKAVKHQQRCLRFMLEAPACALMTGVIGFGVMNLYTFLALWERHRPDFVVLDGSFLFLLVAFACLGLSLLFLIQVRRSRHGRTCDAYSDHFRIAVSQMRPEHKQGIAIGEMLIPWSAVASYSWKPDHLELSVRPGRPHNRICEHWRVFGVVPPEQRQAAHAFLSARMPGEGQPRGS